MRTEQFILPQMTIDEVISHLQENEEIRKNINAIIELIKNYSSYETLRIVESLGIDEKNNVEVIKEALNNCSSFYALRIYENAGETPKNDLQIVKTLLFKLKNYEDIQIVLNSLNENVKNAIKKDQEVAKHIVKYCTREEDVDDIIVKLPIRDKEIIRLALLKCQTTDEFFKIFLYTNEEQQKELISDKEVIISALEHSTNGKDSIAIFGFAGSKCRKDVEIVKLALKECIGEEAAIIIEKASVKPKNDIETIKLALNHCVRGEEATKIYMCARKNVLSDKDILNMALNFCTNGGNAYEIFEKANEAIKYDPAILVRVLTLCPKDSVIDVIKAIQKSSHYFYAHERTEFYRVALSRNGLALKCFTKYKDTIDRKLTEIAIKENGCALIYSDFRDDFEMIKLAFEHCASSQDALIIFENINFKSRGNLAIVKLALNNCIDNPDIAAEIFCLINQYKEILNDPEIKVIYRATALSCKNPDTLINLIDFGDNYIKNDIEIINHALDICSNAESAIEILSISGNTIRDSADIINKTLQKVDKNDVDFVIKLCGLTGSRTRNEIEFFKNFIKKYDWFDSKNIITILELFEDGVLELDDIIMSILNKCGQIDSDLMISILYAIGDKTENSVEIIKLLLQKCSNDEKALINLIKSFGSNVKNNIEIISYALNICSNANSAIEILSESGDELRNSPDIINKILQKYDSIEVELFIKLLNLTDSKTRNNIGRFEEFLKDENSFHGENLIKILELLDQNASDYEKRVMIILKKCEQIDDKLMISILCRFGEKVRNSVEIFNLLLKKCPKDDKLLIYSLGISGSNVKNDIGIISCALDICSSINSAIEILSESGDEPRNSPDIINIILQKYDTINVEAVIEWLGRIGDNARRDSNLIKTFLNKCEKYDGQKMIEIIQQLDIKTKNDPEVVKLILEKCMYCKSETAKNAFFMIGEDAKTNFEIIFAFFDICNTYNDIMDIINQIKSVENLGLLQGISESLENFKGIKDKVGIKEELKFIIQDLRKELLRNDNSEAFLEFLKRFYSEFVNSGATMEQFADMINMPENEIKIIIDRLKKIDAYSEGINNALQSNQNKYLRAINKTISGVLNGEIGIAEATHVKAILEKHLKAPYSKFIFFQKLLDADISNPYTYQKVLTMNFRNKTDLIDGIINFFKEYKFLVTNSKTILRNADKNDEAEQLNPKEMLKKWNDKINLLEGYKKPYNEEELLKYSFATLKGKKNAVSEEHIENAKRYLILTHQYLCNATMVNTLRNIVLGKITEDDIKQLEAKSGLSAFDREVKDEEREKGMNALRELKNRILTPQLDQAEI